MIYLTTEEQTHKESYLKNYSSSLINAYRRRKSLSDVYWAMLDRQLHKPVRVLDAGAGAKGMLQLFHERHLVTVGVDRSFQDLRSNTHLTYRVCADAQQLPFKRSCFDLVVSQWLLEHLPSPRSFYRETSRVLRGAGRLLVVSNSLFCPLMLFNAGMPAFLRDNVKKALLPKEVEEDTFPTFYRANTEALSNRISGDAGFEQESFVYANDLSFFVFNKLLFAVLLLWDRLTETRPLRPLRMHFIALYKKLPDGRRPR